MHPLMTYAYQFSTGEITPALPRLSGSPLWGMLPFMHETGMLGLTDKAYEVTLSNEHRAVTFWLATLPIVFMMNQAHIKKALLSERDYFVTRGKALEGLEVAIGEGNIFSLHNTGTWEQLRSVHRDTFLTNRSLNSFFPMLQSVIKDHLEEYQGKETDLMECFVHLTMKVVTQTVLGIHDNLTAEQARDLSDAITNVFVQITEPMNLAWHTLNKQLKALGVSTVQTPLTDSAVQLQSVVKQHIMTQHDEQATPSSQDTDWIQQMRDMHPDDPDAVLRDVTMVFLAGHETTSRLALFLLVLLKTHPEALHKIQAELATKSKSPETLDRSELNECHYLRACVAETLRLYPPVPHIAREVLKPVTFSTPGAEQAEFTLKEGTLILMSPYHLHRDEHYFEEPLAFKPERFLTEQGVFKNKHLDEGYIPFGEGPRDCAGRQFAIFEAMAIIAQMVTHFDIEMDHAAHPLDVIIPGTLKPRDQIKCTFTQTQAKPATKLSA